MPLKQLPLPKQIYDAEPESLVEGLGSEINNFFRDAIGRYHSRAGYNSLAELVSSSVGCQGAYYCYVYDIVIGVHAGNIYSVDKAGTVTDITGDTLELTGNVSFTEGIDASGVTYIIMANGGAMITYINSGTTVKMSTLDTAAGGDGTVPGEGAYAGVTSVAFMDGFVLCNETGTKNWYWSDPDDCRVWLPATRVNQAVTDPDELLAIKVLNRQIYLFGPNTVEVWYNDGYSPFGRIDGGFIQKGCGAPSSISTFSNEIYFVANDDSIIKLVGTRWQVISLPIMDSLEELSYIGDAIGYVASMDRRALYVLNFPYADTTFALDLASGMWSQIGQHNDTADTWAEFTGRYYCYATKWRKHIIASKDTAELFEWNKKYTSDNGTMIVCMMRTAPVLWGTHDNKQTKYLSIKCTRGKVNESELAVRFNENNEGWGDTQTVTLSGINDKLMFAELHWQGAYESRQYEFRHAGDERIVIAEVLEEFELMEDDNG